MGEETEVIRFRSISSLVWVIPNRSLIIIKTGALFLFKRPAVDDMLNNMLNNILILDNMVENMVEDNHTL